MSKNPTASTSSDGPTEQRDGKSGGNQNRAEVERIAGMGVGAGLGQFAILFDVSGGIAAQPEAGQDERQAPGDGGGLRARRAKFEEIERGGEKAERHANAAGDALPAGDPVGGRTALTGSVIGPPPE